MLCSIRETHWSMRNGLSWFEMIENLTRMTRKKSQKNVNIPGNWINVPPDSWTGILMNKIFHHHDYLLLFLNQREPKQHNHWKLFLIKLGLKRALLRLLMVSHSFHISLSFMLRQIITGIYNFQCSLKWTIKWRHNTTIYNSKVHVNILINIRLGKSFPFFLVNRRKWTLFFWQETPLNFFFG